MLVIDKGFHAHVSERWRDDNSLWYRETQSYNFLSMITSRILFCEAHHELGLDHGMGLAL